MSKIIKRDPFKLYGVKSFEDKAAFAKQNFTDAGGIILARNLEHLSTEIFTQEYAELTFLAQGITVNNEGGYADSIKKLKIAIEGGYRESGHKTDTMGKISLNGDDDSIPTFSMEAESDWSEIELKKAEMQNINLPSRFLEAHAEVYNRKIDTIGYMGQKRTNGTFKTRGLLNYAGWDTDTSAVTAAAATGLELYQEIADLIVRQWNNVFNVPAYKADHVVMPFSVYNQATAKFLNTAGTELSVLRALELNFPTVTFGMTDKAEAGQAAVTSVTVAMSSNRRGMQFRLPVPLEVSSIDQRGFKYYVESYFSIAGLDVIEDGAAATLTGL
jgi:hypothetical protein